MNFLFGIALDTAKIEKLLKNFYTLTNIRIAFISPDFNEFIKEPEAKCSFCEILKKDERAFQNCRESDKFGCDMALKNANLYIYECHAGLTEAVSPIIINGKLLGYLMMGQTLNSPPTAQLWEKKYAKCANYKVDFKALENAFYELHHLDREKIYAAASIMDMDAKYIDLSKLARLQAPSLIEKVKSYIEYNMDKSITISDISRDLNLSKSYLSHLIKSELNTSLTRYLQHKRIEKVKYLLEQTDMKISDISVLIGILDQNYLSKLFKRLTGCSPKKYRLFCKEKAELY